MSAFNIILYKILLAITSTQYIITSTAMTNLSLTSPFLVRVKSKTYLLQKNKNDQEATNYYITSIPFKMHKKMFEAIRTHWSIENKLHWKLDVGMHEDDCQIYRGFADQNLAAMRKIVLALLDSEKSYKAGVELKRHKAALSTRYLRKVIGF